MPFLERERRPSVAQPVDRDAGQIERPDSCIEAVAEHVGMQQGAVFAREDTTRINPR